MSDPPDEFEWIARVLRPLAKNAPEALDLADDAAVVEARPGFDLVVSQDTIVEGVHFLADDAPDLVARKLLRVNLSDLAGKGAEPYGYLLAIAWPARFGWPEREAFARGLADDQTRFGLKLFGGDTTATPGPLVASVTILGWVPAGGMVRRAGAAPGDVVLVSGTIGDGGLGLRAAKGELVGVSYHEQAWLAARYRLPEPRLSLGDPLRALAHAAADVSDGLVADAGHIAEASGVGVELDLDRLPLSEAAHAWFKAAADPVAARAELATSGDDYEVVCTASAARAGELVAAASALGVPMTEVGTVTSTLGVRVFAAGRQVAVPRRGYVHR
ncbi:MAG TPA: thiamine-phosphate kinase [Caulobacteraceae bacterium]|nr:thiamine-phosphate kinase [Caulobacteraceae bacterium]